MQRVILCYRHECNNNACLKAITVEKIVLSSPKLSPSTERLYDSVEMFLRGVGGTYTKPNSSATQLAVARKVYLRPIRWAPAVSEVNGGWTTVRRQLLACVVLLSKNMKTERLIRALLQNQGNTFFCNHLPLNKTVSDLLI